MWDVSDPGVWSLILTAGSILATLAFRKRIGAWMGRLLFTNAVEFVQDTFFDEVVVKDPDGKKRVLRRPNERLEAFFSVYGPLSAAWAMEWAKRNVKIKLPPFELPEGVDLKTAGMSALAQKALSGKKIVLEDAIPLLIGYGKEWLEKSGILETVGKIGKPKGAELSADAKRVLEQAKA